MSSCGLLLWDIDGTLLAGGDPDHIDGLRHELSIAAGCEVTFDGIALGGNIERRISAEALTRAGVDPADIARLSAEAIERLGHRYETTVQDRRDRLLPGVVDTLSLTGSVVAAGVLTGGARRVARAKLAAAGLAELLPFGAYGDEADERHELVEHACAEAIERGVRWCGCRAHVVLIGDTPADISAARSSGAVVIAVATGRWSADDLAAHRPDALLEDLSDPGAVLDAVHRVRREPCTAPGVRSPDR